MVADYELYLLYFLFSSSTVTSQRPSSRSTSTSTSLHLALSSTATTASHPMTPSFGHPHHSSLFPHFPSFHAHPGALGGYSHGPAGESPFPYPSNALNDSDTGLTPPHTTPLGKEGHLENVEVYGGVKTMAELST